MSSGYVTTNLPRVPDRVRPKGAPVKVNLASVNPIAQFSVNDYRFENPITSFRSGPSFEREVRKPGAFLGEQTLNELLVSEAGDLGHQFSMKRVTEFYGRTFSKRPDVSCSPRWGQVTNPIPAGIVFSDGQDTLNGSWLTGQSSYGGSPGWGFAKSESDLVTLGTSFIKATNPIQSQVNLLSSIAEAITDGALIPELLGKKIVESLVNPSKRRGIVKAIGGEYLNYIFGYKPLADDIAKVGVLIDQVNSIVDQWVKDSGTIVRRRRKIPGKWTVSEERVIPSNKSVANSSVNFPIPGAIANNGYKNTVELSGIADSGIAQSNMAIQGFGVRRVNSELTFSAGYEYDISRLFLPVAGGSAAEVMHSAALRNELKAIAFGLDPSSISTALYDATPFSWLLDWFVNLGDVIDNFRGLISRGVQMLWGYMAETVTRDSYYEWNLTWKPSGNVFFRTNGLCTQKVITRVRATPFGFGTTFGSLTGSQSTTLAALAGAKSPETRQEPGLSPRVR